MTDYAFGSNVPGYLPDGESFVYESAAAARAEFVSELVRAADEFADLAACDGDESEWRRIVWAYEEAAEAAEAAPLAEFAEGWSVHLPASDSPHDLGRVFWVERVRF